jgi:hypothetical protein
MYNPGSDALAIEELSPKDQYETPAHIWRFAVERFRLDRDAHASSLNAVMPAYATRADDGLVPGARYWLNPAYGGHCVTIAEALKAFVWREGCAVVALLPGLMHTDWYAPPRAVRSDTLATSAAHAVRIYPNPRLLALIRWHHYVMRADALYYLRDKVRFTNPFLDEVVADYMFSFVLAVWEPTPSAVPPVMQPLDLPRPEASDPGQLLRVRRCHVCGKYRVLPRHQSGPSEPFECASLADPQFASCSAPCPVWL